MIYPPHLNPISFLNTVHPSVTQNYEYLPILWLQWTFPCYSAVRSTIVEWEYAMMWLVDESFREVQ